MTLVLTRLFGAAGIDFDQWKALTRALMWMDVRTTRVHGGIGAATQSVDNQSARFARQSAMYVLMGVAAAVLVALVDDVMLSATLVRNGRRRGRE